MCQRTHNLFYFILVGGRLFFNTLNGLASLFGSQAEDIHSSGKITRAETASRLRDATYQLSIGPVDLKRFQLLIILGSVLHSRRYVVEYLLLRLLASVRYLRSFPELP